MSPRPLRQFYGHDRPFALDGLAPPAEPFRRHRARFLEALHTLSPDQWAATTRCDAWDAKNVVNHLVAADDFWALTLHGRSNPEPTSYLRGFDPTTSPDAYIAGKRDCTTAESLEELERSSRQLADALASITDDEWALVSESPFGHMPVSVIAAHALWDSWLHERDILLPLGRTTPIEDDELLTAAAFMLFLCAAQGGVLDDEAAVGEGPDAPLEATLSFNELADRALRVCVDRGVAVQVVSGADAAADAVDAGSAVGFVEGFSGRAPVEPAAAPLPADVAAQLLRGREIL